jgi:hypothetical protein
MCPFFAAEDITPGTKNGQNLEVEVGMYKPNGHMFPLVL